MLVRTDIRTPFGGKPRLLPDVLRLRSIRSSIMGDYRLYMAEQDARLRQVEAKIGEGEKRPNPVISWFDDIDWRGYMEFLSDVANTVAAGLGYILLALAAIVWLVRP